MIPRGDNLNILKPMKLKVVYHYRKKNGEAIFSCVR